VFCENHDAVMPMKVNDDAIQQWYYLTVRRIMPRSFCREYWACKRVWRMMAKLTESKRLQVPSCSSSADTIATTMTSETYFLPVRTVCSSNLTALARSEASLCLISSYETLHGLQVIT
jgi:hypothetical protein